ncbi:MAG: hypothetical protein RBR87_14380 [Bacteroidales bacterium]|jgi:hypothetical protein|nr:hypothetical protein [Bacteroidales bacterium]
MKTTYFLTAVILCLVSSLQISAGEYRRTDEAYVNDIPFDTKQIFDSVQYQEAITASFIPNEESFIDDIPFDTKKVALQYLADSAMEIKFNMPEEQAINDIPFNTSYIVNHQNSYLTNLKH